ncbi:MAG: prepilin-type N-terminal cleavage/methylation domain-containing protein [Candidatus Gracilibacteria bacterium]|nr:prepilin-type N-terminal cleavage/methylation domain-containing protein [Candidatus Gracilibacteria bacterium]
MFKKVNNAFTLIEILVVISMIMILLVGLSKIDLSKGQNQQKSLSFAQKIQNPIDTTITNALIGKGVGSNIIVPKSWKIEIGKSVSSLGGTGILNIYYETGGTYRLNESINSDKFYNLNKIECLDINGTPISNIFTGTIIISGSDIKTGDSCPDNRKGLRLITEYKNEFPNLVLLNTVSGVVSKGGISGITYATAGTCSSGYHDEGLGCIGDTASCSITNGTGIKTWDIGTSSWGSCSYVSCNTNYTWDGTMCGANTQVYICSSKPSIGTIWNTVGSYTQTWNVSAWTPADTSTIYSTTASSTSCNYKCDTNYTRNGSSCIANTQTYTCTGLPANAAWNTVSNYTQTWNGSSWNPVNTTSTYNTTASTTSCRYKCNAGYHTENSGLTCVSDNQSCAITNGIGSKTWDSGTSSWGACTLLSCNVNFYNYSGSCFSALNRCKTRYPLESNIYDNWSTIPYRGATWSRVKGSWSVNGTYCKMWAERGNHTAYGHRSNMPGGGW